MELLEIENRYVRLFKSIEIFNHDGPSEFMAIEIGGGGFKIKEEAALNKMNLIVSSFANFKDHLKKAMRAKGGDTKIIEQEVEKRMALKLMIDLNNAEKHGYPVRPSKSGFQPKIIPTASIKMSKSGAILTVHPGTGEVGSTGGTVKIGGHIVKYNSDPAEVLCNWDDLIQNALIGWDNIMRTHKLIDYKKFIELLNEAKVKPESIPLPR